MEVNSEFRTFIRNLGLREITAEILWEGDIRTPQELACTEISRIEELVRHGQSLNLLKDLILPALQKDVLAITTAADPYAKAMEVVRSESTRGPSPVNIPPQQTGLAADSTPFFSDSRTLPPLNTRNSVPNQNQSTGQTLRRQSGSEPSHQAAECGSRANIQVSGGTFIQANIQPGNVEYRNQNSQLNVSVLQGEPRILSSLNLNDISFRNEANYRTSSIRVRNADPRTSENHLNNNAIYPVRAWGKSRALIINNINFRQAPKREGAGEDSINLQNLLGQLGFVVTEHKDLTAQAIRQTLSEFTGSPENNDASMILVFIGSHGIRENNRDFLFGVDHEKLSEEDVVNYFVESQSPLIRKEIPKIFLFQFCRLNSQTAADSIVEIEEPRNFGFTQSDAEPSYEREAQNLANMLIAFATAPGTKAYRDTRKGSWFVTALVKVFEEHAHNQDLATMLTMVNNEVCRNEGEEGGRLAVQLTEFKSFLCKKVYFFPGGVQEV